MNEYSSAANKQAFCFHSSGVKGLEWGNISSGCYNDRPYGCVGPVSFGGNRWLPGAFHEDSSDPIPPGLPGRPIQLTKAG